MRLLGDDLRLADRAALAALLRGVGLSDVDAARVSDDSAWAIVLEPGGDGESRLGGRPVLAAGTPWPAAEGRPLTHLATIALRELPDVDGRDVLAPDGYLGFFADLSDEGEFYEPVGPGSPRPELVRTVYVPPGAETYEPQLPHASDRAAWISLRSCSGACAPSRGCRSATSPMASSARSCPASTSGRSTSISRLRRPINGDIEHQLLGYPDVVQGDPRGRPTDVAVFHMAATATSTSTSNGDVSSTVTRRTCEPGAGSG